MTDQIDNDAMMFNWAHKTPAEIVYEFVCIRGDLSERYAQDHLARIIQWKIDQAQRPCPHHNDSDPLCFASTAYRERRR